MLCKSVFFYVLPALPVNEYVCKSQCLFLFFSSVSHTAFCCSPLLFLLLPWHTPVPTPQCDIAWLSSWHLYWTKTKPCT